MLAARGRGAAAVRAAYGGVPGHPVVLERPCSTGCASCAATAGRATCSRASELEVPCDDLAGETSTPPKLDRCEGPPDMKLEQSFEVAAPLERVWEALDRRRARRAVPPGAEITEATRTAPTRDLHGQARPDHGGLPRHAEDGGGRRGGAPVV